MLNKVKNNTGQLLAFQDTALRAQQAGINLQPQELVRMHTN